MKKRISLILAMLMILSTALLAVSCAGNGGDAKITVNSDGEYTVGVCQLVELIKEVITIDESRACKYLGKGL